MPPESAQQGIETAEELIPVADWMQERGLSPTFADKEIIGHDGNPVPLSEALACGPARMALDALIEERKATAKELGVDNIVIDGAVIDRFVKKMGERAQSTPIAPGQPGAGEK